MTAKVFWQYLLTLPINSAKLGNFLSNDFEPLDLGLYKGRIPLRVELEVANLQEMEDQPSLPQYDWVYPDDVARAVGYSSDSLPNGQSRVRVERDGPFRRFYEVGAVTWWRNGEWERTGHILVLDLDKGRQRHPWIILLNEWIDW